MSIERIIGIDFGTSTSVMRVKRYRENGQSVDDRLYTAEVKFENNSLVPTLIRKMQPGAPYYGYDAQKEHKKSTLLDNFKVDLENPDPQKREQARALTEEFFAYLAKKYKEQESVGFFGEVDETEKTLVSYPVKWSDETRKFMLEAAKKAGFKNVEGMDEAQAAITAVMVQSADYLSQRGYLHDEVPVNILMADMGAGTTDLVLCRYTPGESTKYEILSAWPKDGGTLFGGREVEMMLQGYLRGRLPDGDADRVMKRCSLSKFKSWKESYLSKALSRNETVTEFAEFDEKIEDLEIDIEEYAIDRNEFETIAADYLKGFPMLVNGCLKEAGLSGDEVDLVLLTGGHSQWYFVKEQFCGRLDRFGAIGLGKMKADPERIILLPRPQETVALGLVYSPLMRKIQFAEKVGKEISTELEFEINRLKRENIDKLISEYYSGFSRQINLDGFDISVSDSIFLRNGISEAVSVCVSELEDRTRKYMFNWVDMNVKRNVLNMVDEVMYRVGTCEKAVGKYNYIYEDKKIDSYISEFADVLRSDEIVLHSLLPFYLCIQNVIVEECVAWVVISAGPMDLFMQKKLKGRVEIMIKEREVSAWKECIDNHWAGIADNLSQRCLEIFDRMMKEVYGI